MKCSKCGTENPQGKNVCLKCGAFLYSSNPKNRQPLTPEQKKSRRRARAKGSALGCLWTLLIIVGAFVVLGLLVFVLVNYILPQDLLDFMYSSYTSASETIGTTLESALETTVR